MDGGITKETEAPEISHFSQSPSSVPYANYPVYQPQSSTYEMTSYYATNECCSVDQQRQQINVISPTATTNSMQRKPGRNHYTREQKNALEKSFAASMYVSNRERDEIAKNLSLTSKQVKVWYQNRRQKDKRRNGKPKILVMKVSPSAGSPDSGVQEVDDGGPQPQQQLRQKEIGEIRQSVEYVEKSYVASPPPIYSYLSSAAPQPATTSAGVPTMQHPMDYSAAFANYYNNYDYHFPGAYQYYQFMNGYQSHLAATATTGTPTEANAISAGAPLSTGAADHSYPGGF